MKALRHILIAAFAVIAASASAQITYDQAKTRAERFFGYGEWASASALYNYMLDQKPTVSDSYGRAIVANEMLGDSIRSMDLLSQAMAHNIPLDSVLSQVRKYAFAVGKGRLYEDFMLQAARQNSWLARPLDHQLLKYYTFRNDGPQMIRYAQTLLNGAPRDIRFLSTLAKGYMLDGQPAKAVETWQSIIDIAPDDYNALLCLANYYELAGDRARARDYFARAEAIRPTPYVTAILSNP